MGRDAAAARQWDGGDYAAHSGHHRTFDDWFLERCPPEASDVVVDLGCGSGEFSARLASLVPDGRVIGEDPDGSMIEQARRHSEPNLRFVRAAAEEVDGVLDPDSADPIVSRAMLHWLPVSRYRDVFEAALGVLRPGGWFHSESGGAGNVAAVARLLDEVAAEHGLDPVAPFPDAGTVFELVERSGFELPGEAVRTVAQRRSFTRDELVAFLRSQASVALTRRAPAGDAGSITEAIVGGADRLRRHDGSWDQTFVRLEILARRPSGPTP